MNLLVQQRLHKEILTVATGQTGKLSNSISAMPQLIGSRRVASHAISKSKPANKAVLDGISMACNVAIRCLAHAFWCCASHPCGSQLISHCIHVQKSFLLLAMEKQWGLNNSGPMRRASGVSMARTMAMAIGRKRSDAAIAINSIAPVSTPG